MNAIPIVRDVVLLGGGHSHVIVIRKWAMNPIPGVRLTLISQDAMTPYSGMLPGLVAGHYSFEESHIDLNRLCRWSRVRFVEATVTGLDPEQRRVRLDGRPDMQYDLLSIDTGGAPKLSVVDGAEQYTTPVKPVYRFWSRWQEIEGRARDSSSPQQIGVVGGGAGGFEILMAMQHRLATLQPAVNHVFHWLFRSEMLPGFSDRVKRMATDACADRGINVRGRFEVMHVTGDAVHNQDGEQLMLDEVLWCTEASAARWPSESGLACDERGFIALNDNLQSTSHENVFAAGDVAVQLNHPRPRAGVFAVRQGPALFENLQRAALEQPLKPHRPQDKFLTLLSLGRKRAIAQRGPLSVEGDWVWRWKDWIDQKFMNRFNKLPKQLDMESEPLSPVLEARLGTPIDAMRCGGCGAKVAGDVLADALAQLDSTGHGGPSRGVSDGDDVAMIEPDPGLLVQSVDQLRSLVDDPWLFARLATQHAMSDLFAAGVKPHSALLTLGLPHARDEVTARELDQLLDGVNRELGATNCQLIGGHTSETTELTVGVTVNGFIESEKANRLTLDANRYAIILTKPLGIGVIMAADAQGEAVWSSVGPCLQAMLQSNAAAAKVLSRFSVVRQTDVTGFGFLGHLGNMLKHDSGEVILNLQHLPLLPGVEALSIQGVQSSLYEANQRYGRKISRQTVGEVDQSDPRVRLLYDPQTSGGLLVLVAESDADACVDALREAGFSQASQTGVMIPDSGDGKQGIVNHLQT